MRKINHKAVAVATLVAFVFSSLYYSPLLLGKVWNELRGIPPGEAAPAMTVWKPIVELVRTLIVAYVFARLIALLGFSGWKSAMLFGLWMWIGFPVIILTGSVLWENVPVGVAAIHAGDWLVRALLFCIVFTVWRPGGVKENRA